MSHALTEAQLLAFVKGTLSADERARVNAALDADPSALELVALLAAQLDDGPDRGPAVKPSAELGRYRLLSRIGSGGMGVVFEARDQELDRVVALKVLRHVTEVAQERFRREGRALARVRHPGVVDVFDVGQDAGVSFIVMERLFGNTLRRWCGGRRRGWAEVLGVLVRAGRGLAAAHERGLVHRDFKPSNVLVTRDDRVVLVDFGLVGAQGSEGQGGVPSASDRGEADSGVTASAIAVGTPAYMAPEQRRGAECSALADQYSFCASALECLTGRLAGDPRQRTVARPVRGRIPASLREVLLQGMSEDPAGRFETMNDLLARLDRVRERARLRRRLVRTGAGVASLAGLAVFASSDSRPDGCEQQTLSGVWDEDVRASLEASFLQDPRPWTNATLARVQALLDRFARDWSEDMARACAPSASDPATQRAQLACLEHEREALRSVIAATVHGDEPPAQMPRALATVDLGRCGASSSGEQPEETNRARASLTRARTHLDAGEHAQAQEQLRLALDHAMASGRADITAEALIEQIIVVGHALGDLDEAESLARHAEAWSQRAGRPPQVESNRAVALGWLALDGRQATLARARFSEALEHVAQWPDHDPRRDEIRRRAQVGLAVSHARDWEMERARELLSEAEQDIVTHLGAEHPDLVPLWINRANLERNAGNLEASKALLERAQTLVTRDLGARHPRHVEIESNLASVAINQRDPDAALRYADSALRRLDRLGRSDHPTATITRQTRAEALLRLGRFDESLAEHDAAVERIADRRGASHPAVADYLLHCGRAYFAAERYEEARARLERALTIFEQEGSEDPRMANPLVFLAQMDMMDAQTESAVTRLRRAAELARGPFAAYTYLRLGQALHETGELEAAREQLELAEDVGPQFEEERQRELEAVRSALSGR